MDSKVIEFGSTAVIGFRVDGKDQTEMQEKCQQFVNEWVATVGEVHVEGVEFIGFAKPDGDDAAELFERVLDQNREKAN